MQHTQTPFDELVGKIITKLEVGDYTLKITLENNEEIYFIACGDCCSESWFSDIEGLRSILGKVVTGIYEPDFTKYDVEDGRCRQECDQYYGFRIMCEENWCDIMFRNSSNGYYGGWIEKFDSSFEKESFEIVSSDSWKSK